MNNRYFIYLAATILLLTTVDNICYADENRKGFIFSAGLGGGYTSVSSTLLSNSGFSTFGLGLTAGLGYAPSNKSSLIFGFKSNIFIDEVASVWQNWHDKMQGDDLGALGAKLISPFVYSLSPLFRSHSIFGIVEYTYFLNETSPSFLFSGTVGGGFLYDKIEAQTVAGLGLSAGAGYEFTGKVAIQCDLLYTSSPVDKLQSFSVLLTLKKYFY